jgi:hypothetical protein
MELTWTARGNLRERVLRYGKPTTGKVHVTSELQNAAQLARRLKPVLGEHIRIKSGRTQLYPNELLQELPMDRLKVSIWRMRRRYLVVVSSQTAVAEQAVEAFAASEQETGEVSDPCPTPSDSEEEPARPVVQLTSMPNIAKLLEDVQAASQWQPPTGGSGSAGDGNDKDKDEDQPDDECSDEDEGSMQIFVKVLHGKTYKLLAEPFNTVLDIKKMLQGLLRLKSSSMRLKLKPEGDDLEDGSTLEDYGIQHKSTMHLVVTGAGGGKRGRGKEEEKMGNTSPFNEPQVVKTSMADKALFESAFLAAIRISNMGTSEGKMDLSAELTNIVASNFEKANEMLKGKGANFAWKLQELGTFHKDLQDIAKVRACCDSATAFYKRTLAGKLWDKITLENSGEFKMEEVRAMLASITRPSMEE